jgi:pimeloyl-ACP methyl ester carboxylesterase
MLGSKATALADWAAGTGRQFTRFDYRGHGQSPGSFTDFVLGDWLDDALHILDHVTTGPQIVIGSSMGGWLMLHLAIQQPERVAGLIGIAIAPDFTTELLWNKLPAPLQEKMRREGVFYEPSPYGPEPTPFTYRLVQDGYRHLLLTRDHLPITCPVHLLHGMRDTDVPYQFSERVAAKIGPHAVVDLIQDGDHRLSRPEDITRLLAVVDRFCHPEGA